MPKGVPNRRYTPEFKKQVVETMQEEKQYHHKRYQRMLREKGIRQSMSRKGNCLDNAV